MSDLFLTPEQTGQLFTTPGPLTLRDAAGNVVGQINSPAAAAVPSQKAPALSADQPSRFPVSADALAALCRRYGVQRLGLFGSALRADFRPESDLDLLVEFEPGRKVGLGFFALERELSEMVGRKVDLNTPAFLSQHFRSEVLSQAQPLYDATQ